jgi:drug/metabolite transporter (DMT)-like permease
MFEPGLLVLAELGLTLYPQLIKLININLESQVVIRFITYTILGLLGCTITSTNSGILQFSLVEYIIVGLVNIFHVAASYSTFKIFSSGTSYTLFYTQPIFNLLGRMFIYNEKIPTSKFIYMFIALVGVYILTSKQPETETFTLDNTLNNTLDYNFYITIGLFSGLLAAITESIMYLLVKDKYSLSTFQNLTLFYLFGGIACTSVLLYSYFMKNEKEGENITSTSTNFFNIFSSQHLDFNISFENLIKAIGFNAIIGFSGYFLLYYLVNKTSTILFNSIIFLGIIFSYMWGYFLGGELIILENIIGSGLIIFAIFMINL